MNQETAINIGLHINNQVIDLRVPNQVTMTRLEELLRESLVLLKVNLPQSFSLELINKPIDIDKDVLLDNYPIGNGDQFIVTEFID